MRVQSYGYGNAVFDVRREFQNSRRKTKKLIAYFILSAIVFYIVRFVLELNSMIFIDSIHKSLNGEPIDFNFGYIIEQAKSNKIIAFLLSVYYFMEKSVFSVKDFIQSFAEKISLNN